MFLGREWEGLVAPSVPGEVQLGHQGKLLFHKSENALEQAAQEVVVSTGVVQGAWRGGI